MKEASSLLVKRMQKPGKRIRYPVNWDSERQRKAFFATNGFRRKGSKGGIPTKRTNAHIKAWKIVKVPGGYSVQNKRASAVYVYGNDKGKRQSKIHKGRWPLFRTEALAVRKVLPIMIREHLKGMFK